MNTTVKRAMLMLALLISAGALAPAALARAAADTPEHCQKRCMGNDTPTERANCLKSCPQASAPARTMSELAASNPPPRMGGRFHSGLGGTTAVGPRTNHLIRY
jgi:hypothetical protein